MPKRIYVKREVIVFNSAQNKSGLITLLKVLSVIFITVKHGDSTVSGQPVLIFAHVKERSSVPSELLMFQVVATSCDVTVDLKEE